jgi:hypothetical protein
MATAKRLYLYTVAGVGLALALSGAAVMIRTLLNHVFVGPQMPGAVAVPADRDALAMGVALAVTGMAVWLLHWTVLERMVQGEGDAPIAERRSIVRSVYFVWVLATTVLIATGMTAMLATKVIADRLNAGGKGAGPLSSLLPVDDAWALAAIIVACAAFGYHAWIRDRDLRQTTLISGAAAWISRYYLYGAAFAGLVMALDNVSGFFRIVTGEWASLPAAGGMSILGSAAATSSWVRPAVAALVGVAVWGAVWAAHWLYSERLRKSAVEQGRAEQVSRVRLAFLATVVLWGATVVAGNVADGLGSLVGSLLDVKSSTPTWYAVFVPPIAAIPAAIALWWYRGQALSEEHLGPAGVSATRITLYLIALVGLAALVSGATQIIAAVLDQAFSPVRVSSGDHWKVGVSLGLGMVVVGAAVWAWPWRMVLARCVADAATEIVSSARSYYLYLVMGASLIAVAVSSAVILYRYLRLALGLHDANLWSAVDPQIAMLVVAGAVLAFHWRILRLDLASHAKG